MTTFSDGPAKDQYLPLQRSPIFLRVVEWAGIFDALDQLDDEPDPRESIYVYYLTDVPVPYHWDGRDKNNRRTSGWGKIAIYRQFPNAPDEETLRDTARWREWCQRTMTALRS